MAIESKHECNAKYFHFEEVEELTLTADDKAESYGRQKGAANTVEPEPQRCVGRHRQLPDTAVHVLKKIKLFGNHILHLPRPNNWKSHQRGAQVRENRTAADSFEAFKIL